MLGHRGCRLGITHPEIYGMQVRAIMEAACTVAEQGGKVEPEIMIPLTGTVGEMRLTYEQTKRIADGVVAELGVPVKYTIGTMIEVPRAALIADQIAAGRGVLLLRHQRSHPADLRLQPRRRRQVPARLSPEGTAPARSLRRPGPGGGRRADPHRDRAGPADPARPQGGHLRRARRRALVGGVLPSSPDDLRVVFTVPDPHRPPRRRPGPAQGARGGRRRAPCLASTASTFRSRPRSAATTWRPTGWPPIFEDVERHGPVRLRGARLHRRVPHALGGRARPGADGGPRGHPAGQAVHRRHRDQLHAAHHPTVEAGRRAGRRRRHRDHPALLHAALRPAGGPGAALPGRGRGLARFR